MSTENTTVAVDQESQEIKAIKTNPRREPHSIYGPTPDASGLTTSADLPESDAATPRGFRVWIDPENYLLMGYFINDFQETARSTVDHLSWGEPVPGFNAEDVAKPRSWLKKQPTQREQEVLHQLAAGFTNKEMAANLDISDQTIKNHITGIFYRFSCNDRSDAVLHAINHGMIEPMLISFEADFSHYSELGTRERQVYELLTGEESNSNKEIAEKLFITEQTVKRHMTSVLRITGTFNRSEVALYESKRQEKILKGDKDSLGLTTKEDHLLSLVAKEPSLRPEAMPDLGIINGNLPGMKNIYGKLAVSNYIECAAVSLLYGFGPVDTFASPKAQRAIEVHLSPEQKDLLIRVSSFNDDAPLKLRADFMGMDQRDLRKQLAEISGEALITGTYPDMGSPFVYQAMVMLRFNQLKEAKRKIEKRQEHLRTLAKDRITTIFKI